MVSTRGDAKSPGHQRPGRGEQGKGATDKNLIGHGLNVEWMGINFPDPF